MFLSEPLLKAIQEERMRAIERTARERRLLSPDDPEDAPVTRTAVMTQPASVVGTPSRSRGSACEAV